MTDGQPRDNPFLRWAAIAFVIGFAIHGLDHLRRGMSASPPFVMVGGGVQALLVAAAVVVVFTHRGRAPLAAIAVGFGSALAFTYVHCPPCCPAIRTASSRRHTSM